MNSAQFPAEHQSSNNLETCKIVIIVIMAFEQILSDLHITKPSYCEDYAKLLAAEIRLKRIAERQMESTSMFSRLQVIIDQIEENFQPPSRSTQEPAKVPAFIADHNYAFSNSSSGISSASSSSSSTITASSSSSPVNEPRFNRCSTLGAKRKIIDDEYQEFSAEDDHAATSSNSADTKYPQQVDDFVILGPNGTQIDARSYMSIIWSSAASATRQLLTFVFSSDILATHTLTGKPSPAFYGRERPAKMQLDPIKAADIIHCVKSKFNCTEREIRAAITTKCSDTSKKYKRRSLKQTDSSNKM